MKRIKVGILGATGMVGQRFVTLLNDHPWFDVVALAASGRSAGRTYQEAVGDRWKMTESMPEYVRKMPVVNVNEVGRVASEVGLVFSAVEMPKDEIRAIEEAYAKAEAVVVSNNSAHRWTQDVPMLIPELNHEHLELVAAQKKRLGTDKGFIVVKPNCSIQSYTPMLYALREYKPSVVVAATYQAISGASKVFGDWPEMLDNVIPYIGGEEEKSEQEPLRIMGKVVDGRIANAEGLVVSTQCIRVPVTDGHMAAIFVTFGEKPGKDEILRLWKEFKGPPQELELPSAPKQFITYFEDDDRPQIRLDRDLEKGMGISAGRLREDGVFDYKFVGLSHNTIRGAAGGGVLSAELLVARGYI